MAIPTPAGAPTTRSDKLEGVAFQFCKIATVSLIAGRFTLPVASGLCSVLYGAAFIFGKRDTRCVLRYPLLLFVVWGLVAVASIAFIVRPEWAGTLPRLPWSR